MDTESTETLTCDTCGGAIPPEGSEAWDASDGECPGHLAHDSDICGAFDPSLPWDEKDEEEEESDDGPVDPRTGETLAAFTARHERALHAVWVGTGEAFAYASQGDCDADAASGGDLSDELVIDTWRGGDDSVDDSVDEGYDAIAED